MHRSPSRRAFTLIEMITVITVIAILTGIVLSVAGLVQTKGARAKAEAEIRALSAACESYKSDNGGYPQDTATDDLDPRVTLNSTDTKYQAASLILYKELSGDVNANGKIDSGETSRRYASDFFKPSRFNSSYKTSGIVTYISDPFGNSYGYSTAGLKVEQDYRADLTTDPNATRPTASKGYNSTFDLWSTGGATGASDNDKAKWVKNW